MTHPATARPSLAALAATALLYMAVVQAMDTPLQGQSDPHLLHPGPGLALALWIWGGARPLCQVGRGQVGRGQVGRGSV